MADTPSELTPAQQRRLDEFAATFGHAPIVAGPSVDHALTQIKARGAVLLHQGEGFDDEYVVILPGGATVPVDVIASDGAISITIKA